MRLKQNTFNNHHFRTERQAIQACMRWYFFNPTNTGIQDHPIYHPTYLMLFDNEHQLELQYPLNVASGWFESAIEDLLCDAPHHESLRLLPALAYIPD